MEIVHPYLLFLGDAADQLAAKTARGIAHWRPDWCCGQLRLAGCNADLGLPDVTLEEAVAQGARTLVIGVANRGGVIPKHWHSVLYHALSLGLDLASGLHERLGDQADLAMQAARFGRRLWDVRHPPAEPLPLGSGARRPGRRLLTVGTDCSVGKMYTSLALEKALRNHGISADFRATGQTGILIAGKGLSVDAVVADFISGAAETLSPAAPPHHWDIVEGQGSLHHPSYAGVTLGLVHGSQPDALVLCHEPGRLHMRGLPARALPSLQDSLEAHLQAARLTNPAVRAVGLSFNTAQMAEAEAKRVMAEAEAAMGLPCIDPVRSGVNRLVDCLLTVFPG